jgi:multiple sugar transport system ATP-binding protein
LNEQDFIARVDSRSDITGGEQVDLAFDMNKALFFDAETEQRIH